MSVSLIDGHIDDDVMTDEQIIKALEYCVSVNSCDDCKKPTPRICTTFETKDFLDLINRQKSEIERFKEECSCLGCENEWLKAHYEQSKAETVKEFAEKLKEKAVDVGICDAQGNGYGGATVILIGDIDSLVKEMVGEG